MGMLKPKLLASWNHNGKPYRLSIVTGDQYREYVVERDDKDRYGDPHWNPVYAWNPGFIGNNPAQDEALMSLVTLWETSKK